MASGSVYTAQYTLPVTPSTSDVTIDYYEETISYDDTTLEVYTTSNPGGTLIGSGRKSQLHLESIFMSVLRRQTAPLPPNGSQLGFLKDGRHLPLLLLTA